MLQILIDFFSYIYLVILGVYDGQTLKMILILIGVSGIILKVYFLLKQQVLAEMFAAINGAAARRNKSRNDLSMMFVVIILVLIFTR